MAALPGSLGIQRTRPEFAALGSGGLFDQIKPVADTVLSLILLVVLSPLMAVCALVIRLSSPGPVILRQPRLGKDGKVFAMYKFRTMRQDAEAMSGPVLAAVNDSRIIPSCKWMRRSHLDEVPQLLNVLRGEMSLVGPRPERPEIAEQIYQRLPEFRLRLQKRPGITGLAQVCNGYDAGLESAKEKLAFDLQYIQNHGFWLEAWILAKTLTKLNDSSSR